MFNVIVVTEHEYHAGAFASLDEAIEEAIKQRRSLLEDPNYTCGGYSLAEVIVRDDNDNDGFAAFWIPVEPKMADCGAEFDSAFVPFLSPEELGDLIADDGYTGVPVYLLPGSPLEGEPLAWREQARNLLGFYAHGDIEKSMGGDLISVAGAALPIPEGVHIATLLLGRVRIPALLYAWFTRKGTPRGVLVSHADSMALQQATKWLRERSEYI